MTLGRTALIEANSELRKTVYHIRGGNDLSPALFRNVSAEGFSSAVELLHSLETICRLRSSCIGGVRETHSPAHVVCTLPFSITGVDKLPFEQWIRATLDNA
jgi:hypothetical protein